MEYRKCEICGEEKPITEFRKYSGKGYTGRGYHKRSCRTCAIKREREDYTPEQIERAKRLDENREFAKVGLHRCLCCGQIKSLSEFAKVKGYPHSRCRKCSAEDRKAKNYAKKSPELKARMDRILKNRDLAKHGLKECAKCGKVKPFADYPKSTAGVHYSECKECHPRTYNSAYGYAYMETEVGFGSYHKCPSCGKFRLPGSFNGHAECAGCRRRKEPKEITEETCKACGRTLPIANFEMFIDGDGLVQHRFVCKECSDSRTTSFAYTGKMIKTTRERGQMFRHKIAGVAHGVVADGGMYDGPEDGSKTIGGTVHLDSRRMMSYDR
jgi:hypothetical protein